MDTNVLRASVCGMATPFRGAQAPDHQARGYATQEPLESETKFYPFERPYPRFKMSNVMKPLPQFAPGVMPTFDRQEGSADSLRGKEIPTVRMEGRVLSADLIEMYAKIENYHRDAPAILSGDYQGSQWMYGAREGLPIGYPTNASNFIGEYGAALSEAEWSRRTHKLVDEGYAPELVKKAMEDNISDYLRKRISTR